MTWPTGVLAPRKGYLTRSAANMTYLVEFSTRASRDLEILFMEKNAAESDAASGWYNGLEEAVYALAKYPFRCPVAPEARKARRSCGTCFMAKSPMSIGSFMKLMSDDK